MKQCCMCCITTITHKRAHHRSHNTNATVTAIRTHVSGVRHWTILSLSPSLYCCGYDMIERREMCVCVFVLPYVIRVHVCLFAWSGLFLFVRRHAILRVLCAVVYCLYHYGRSNVCVNISEIPSAFWGWPPFPPACEMLLNRLWGGCNWIPRVRVVWLIVHVLRPSSLFP